MIYAFIPVSIPAAPAGVARTACVAEPWRAIDGPRVTRIDGFTVTITRRRDNDCVTLVGPRHPRLTVVFRPAIERHTIAPGTVSGQG